jgi:HPt (histidine-containing phosphotransfer) domain-containing protein
MADPSPPFRLDIPPHLEGLLPRFIEEMAKDSRILAALAGGDRGELAEHVHAMRGKCAMFGAAEVADLLADLEGQVAVADQGEIHRRVATIIGRTAHLRVYSESIS